jgi:hypothetical protein
MILFRIFQAFFSSVPSLHNDAARGSWLMLEKTEIGDYQKSGTSPTLSSFNHDIYNI